MARPTKLTPDVQKRLVDAISAGSYFEPACAYAGIAYSTFRTWMERGAQEDGGPYHDLAVAMAEAEGRAEVRLVGLLNKAMPEDWRAIIAFLERRYPARWGRQDRVQAEVAQRTEMTVHGPDEKGDITEYLPVIVQMVTNYEARRRQWEAEHGGNDAGWEASITDDDNAGWKPADDTP